MNIYLFHCGKIAGIAQAESEDDAKRLVCKKFGIPIIRWVDVSLLEPDGKPGVVDHVLLDEF